MDKKSTHATAYVFIVFLCCLLFSSHLLASTTGKISGKVTLKQTKEAIIGANIVVVGTELGAATDKHGEYFIINVAPGTYTVQTSYMGCETIRETNVQVGVNRTTQLDFEMKETAVEGQTVTIVAERPIIVKDLTASERVIESSDIGKSWARSFEEVVEMQTGVFQGHIRGGHILESTYIVDNVSLNSGLVSDNYTGINTSTIQEATVLTGGYNAEFGNAQSGVVNIVTKVGGEGIHGTAITRMKPAGKYHWGPNFYSKDNYDWTHFDLDYWTEVAQNPNSAFYGRDPNELLQEWQKQITPNPIQSEYANRPEYETEVTLYGTAMKNLGFLLSGRYKRGVNIFPQMEEYNPEYNFQGKLSYKLNNAMKLTFNGIFGGYTTSGLSSSNFSTIEVSQEVAWNGLPQITDPYQWNKYAMVGSWVAFPEKRTVNQVSLKWVHVLSPKLFYEFDVSYLYDQVDKTDRNNAVPVDKQAEDDDVYGLNGNYLLQGYNHTEDKISTNVLAVRGDLTSQITKNHQIKAGFLAKAYDFSYYHYMPGLEGGTRWNLINIFDGQPYEGALYFQNKLEFSGLIVNAGLRLDFFNQNRDASKNMFDPLAQLPETPGNVTPNVPGNPETERTPLQTAFSPRLGISHPITDNTVLHFVYGHFYQRPSWNKMYGLPLCNWSTDPDSSRDPWANYGWMAEWQGFLGNAKLGYERTVQFEIGINQNIADLFVLDVTGYYKDASGQTVFREGNLYNPRYGVENAWTWLQASNMGAIMVTNSAYADIRGLEVQLDTRFRWPLNVMLSYDLSYVTGGVVGYDNLFGPGMTGINSPKGFGQNKKPWDRNNKIKANLNLNFFPGQGPAIFGLKPLSDVNLNLYTEFWDGQEYTYHGPGDNSTEPNNMRWKPHFRTNLKLAKGFALMGFRNEISVEVRNLFNNKDLYMLSGDDLIYYEEHPDLPEEERLPKHWWSGEPNVWGWYNIWTNPPRQIYVQLKIDF